jgi:DNA-directed RNA polymerase sigma subunit (sigma70/sigma32)
LGAEPDPRELAVHLGWTVEKVRLLLSVSNDVVSIDAPVRDAEESSLRDLLRSSASPDPEQILAEREERLQIDAVVNELGGVTTEVIRLRFGIGKPEELTLQEIGDMKGRTRERIRQIESKGLRSLRRKSGALRHFWDEARGTKKSGNLRRYSTKPRGMTKWHNEHMAQGATACSPCCLTGYQAVQGKS